MEPQKTGKIPLLPVVAGLMILLPVLIAAGCTGNAPPGGGTAPAGPVADGSRWALTGYLANGTLAAPLAGTTVTLEFPGDNSIAGSAGCNHYFAGYTIDDSRITIGQAGSTMMYCSGPGVMEQESTYLGLLSRAAALTTGRDSLAFSDAEGTIILTYSRIVPPAPEPLAGTDWRLDSLYSGDAVASVISGTAVTALFDDGGRVSGSAGCNRYAGSYTVSGNSLVISSVSSTKMNCHGPGVMQQEDAFLAALQKAKGYSITGNRLTLTDAGGAPLLSFTGQP